MSNVHDIKKIQLLRVTVILSFVVIVIWLSVLVFLRSSPLGAYGQFGDEAIIIQGAERIIDGQIPHRDFYSFPVGGTYYPLALMFKIFGDGYVVVRFFNFSIALGICLALTWIAWPLLRYWAVVVSLIFAFVVYPVWPFLSHHWMILLLALLSTGLVAGKQTTFRLVMAGIIATSGVWIIHQRAILVVITQLLFLLFFRRDSPKYKSLVLFYMLGALAAFAIPMVFIISTGTWHEFFRQVVENNIVYYKQVFNNNFFVANDVLLVSLSSILLLMLPLFRGELFKDDGRKRYAAVFLLYVALNISILYFLEWVHFALISIPIVILGLSLAFALLRSFNMTERTVPAIFSSSRKVVLPIIIILGLLVYAIYFGTFAYSTGVIKPMQSYATLKGTIYMNGGWYSPVVEEYPLVAKLVRTTFAGQRIFFLPYAPGYYYFNNISNPTSFDLVTPNVLLRDDEEWLERDLRDKVDVVMYIPNSWQIDSRNTTMEFIRQNFPYTTSYLNSRIQVFSKKPIPAT